MKERSKERKNTAGRNKVREKAVKEKGNYVASGEESRGKTGGRRGVR